MKMTRVVSLPCLHGGIGFNGNQLQVGYSHIIPIAWIEQRLEDILDKVNDILLKGMDEVAKKAGQEQIQEMQHKMSRDIEEVPRVFFERIVNNAAVRTIMRTKDHDPWSTSHLEGDVTYALCTPQMDHAGTPSYPIRSFRCTLW